MVLEYLLKEPSEKNSIMAYDSKDVKARLLSAKKGDCFYIQYSADGENEENAKKLSEIDEYVRTNYHVTVLENGSAAYFNKRLYPLVSKFEFSLRKLLYLSSAVNSDEKASSNIANLDTKDFGDIFTMLFHDTSFEKRVREDIKNRKSLFFTKDSVIETISTFDEYTLWDRLLGKEVVPTLRKRFNDVRDYRNDVMHSHNINWKRYKEILSLYNDVNAEINEALQEIASSDSTADNQSSFNQLLENAIRAQEQLSLIFNEIKPTVELLHEISEKYSFPLNRKD